MYLARENLPAHQSGFDFCAAVRGGFATVAAQAEHVRIDDQALRSYAASLPVAPPAQTLDENHHFFGSSEATAAYILMLDSLNFGSGYESVLVAEGLSLVDHSFYYTQARRLKTYFEEKGCPSAPAVAKISAKECAAILGLGSGPQSDEFASLCAVNLQQLGQAVIAQAGGGWFAFVERFGGAVNDMLGALAQIDNFKDVHLYKGVNIAFYKRAQITVADLYLSFTRLGTPLFPDIRSLTMFADNAVPHVLHMDGILHYSDELAAAIAAGREIPAGSEQEIELRACAGHAVEKIAAEKVMCAMDIDHILWHRSADNPFYRERPLHRTRTINY